MKLHIGNLPKSVTEQELGALLAPFGTAAAVEIAKDSTGASKGYAFAEFANEDDARKTITALNGKDVSGRALKVSEARARRPETSAPQV